MKTIKISKEVHLKIKIEAAKREVNLQELIEKFLLLGLEMFKKQQEKK